ncbi:hypothetical protein ACFX15_023787 [Malus domestica]
MLHVGTFEEIACDAQVIDLIEDMPNDKVVELYEIDKNVKAISKSDKGAASSNGDKGNKLQSESDKSQASTNVEKANKMKIKEKKKILQQKLREKIGMMKMLREMKVNNLKCGGNNQNSDYDQDSDQEIEHAHENVLEDDLFEKQIMKPFLGPFLDLYSLEAHTYEEEDGAEVSSKKKRKKPMPKFKKAIVYYTMKNERKVASVQGGNNTLSNMLTDLYRHTI